jgi:signal transduction histidine kinase
MADFEPPFESPFESIGSDAISERSQKIVSKLRGGWIKFLVPVIYLGWALAFITDLTYDNTLAFGVAYIPAICTASFYRSPRAVWVLAGISILMVATGYFYPAVNPDLLVSVGNRLLSVLAILVTAALVRHSLHTQEKLAVETARAEAGERVKTEVFENLTNEIRTPLHAVIGFAEVMLVNCRPDQRAPLGQMQNSGKRLLTTIDNLIDLTNLDHRVLLAEPIDVALSLREAAEAARPVAAERHVSLVVEIAEATRLQATADPWAVRRILDNLISNALKFTSQGGTVVLSTEARPEGVIAAIEDTGIGMSPELVQELRAPRWSDDLATITGTGLTLSRRLAQAMRGDLSFDSQLQRGTTVRLHLPA